ncbi:MAG: hypothetical protein OSB10_07055 [Planctomycetota bacterium]|nr:hypothetical protein [Planctomycetota bacterium]
MTASSASGIPLARRRSLGELRANRLDHLVLVRPRPHSELCDQSAFSRGHEPAVCDDFKLATATRRELHGLVEFLFDEGSVTRRLGLD